MKKGFKNKFLSVILSLCLLTAIFLPTALAETDYDALVAGATKHADAGSDAIEATSPGSNTNGFRTNDTSQSGNIAGNISGFTDLKNGNSVEGAVKVTTAADPSDGSNSVLKMTGQTATGAASVYSAFDTRRPESKQFHPTENGNNYLQMWEIKVKLPETETGELRLFVYGNYYWFSTPRYQKTTQVVVKDGNVYRINSTYDPSKTGIAYDDLVAEGLTAGEWYTFVRVMDMRDTSLNKDKLYIFDKDGAQVNSDPEWRNAGQLESYSSRSRLSLGFAGKDFNDGEDVYFDDLRIWYIPESDMVCETDVTGILAETFFAEGNISDPEDIPNIIVSGVAAEGFTTDNIKLYAGEAEIADGCVVSHDGTKGTISLQGIEYDSTYTLAIRNQFGANQWGISVSDKTYTFTIPKDAFVPASGGIVSGTDDSALSKVPSAGNAVKGQVTMTNGSNKSRDCMVLLLLYEGNKLLAATAKNAAVSAGQTTPVTTEALTVPEGSITARVMAWNGWTNSFALGDEYKVEQ